MSLLTGIVGSSGEPQKINTSWGRVTSANSGTTNALDLPFSVSSGQLQIVLHYVTFPTATTPSAPSTPSNFTSLKSGSQGSGEGSNFGYRISYRIFTSNSNSTSLPTAPSGVSSQMAIGFILTPISGFSFSGLSVAEENSNTYTTSFGGTYSLTGAKKNDIGLGLLYGFFNGAQTITNTGGSTLVDFSTVFSNPGQLFSGLDLNQSSRSISIIGDVPAGASMYLLQVLRPTFS